MIRISLIFCLLAACGGSDGDSGEVVEPVVLGPDDTWTWVDVPGSLCMDGSMSGFGIYPSSKSKKLLIFMQDGGACFNTTTCAGVFNPDGYGADKFAGFSGPGGQGSRGIFAKDNDLNAFKDYSMIYVPYCSGDIHAGSRTELNDYGKISLGYENYQKYLNTFYAAFLDVEQVVVSGSSAGGFGAVVNFDQTAEKFDISNIHLLDDSAPPLSDTYNTPALQSHLRDQWELGPSMPEDCTDCEGANGGGLGNFTTFLARKYPESRFGYIQSYRDGTMKLFFGFGNPFPNGAPLDDATMTAAVKELRDVKFAEDDNLHMYSIDSGEHVKLYDNSDSISGGVSLKQWLKDFESGAASWGTVVP